MALLRLDTDFYPSTAHELMHLYPRLSTGGVMIVDDYRAWQGAQQALDEYFRDRPVLLQPEATW
ncbi:MAG TPA: TylF/MycF/NovP-related O-methyltransferase [Vicinamibacterales bacterium]|nr:TylF/MycF/NovP-related O-methyltransferase [Vicinamibacterales bacterium]